MNFKVFLENDNVQALTELLHRVREKTIGSRKCVYGDCELLADEFLSAARTMNLADKANSQVVWGWMRNKKGEEGSHQWVQIGDHFYDAAADQFGYEPVLITNKNDPRYRVAQTLNHTFRQVNKDYLK